MRRTLTTWLTVALIGGAFIAGCGSSSKSTSTSQTASTAATSTPAAAPTTSTGATATGGSGATGAALQAAVALCKQNVQAQPTISASTKGKLEALCNKAASGNPTTLRKIGQEVCDELVNATAAPGAAKEQALAACKNR
jgi:hypothetical protein